MLRMEGKQLSFTILTAVPATLPFFCNFLSFSSSFLLFLPSSVVNSVFAIYSLIGHCVRFTTQQNALSHYLLFFTELRKENFHDGGTKAVLFFAIKLTLYIPCRSVSFIRFRSYRRGKIKLRPTYIIVVSFWSFDCFNERSCTEKI